MCDFYSIKNRSVVLDLMIFLRTIRVVLTGKGARERNRVQFELRMMSNTSQSTEEEANKEECIVVVITRLLPNNEALPMSGDRLGKGQ